VFFNSQDLWKAITVVGGPSTQEEIGYSPYTDPSSHDLTRDRILKKGQPPQLTSHSVRAVAATIPNQPLINPERKA
ncbi:MAG TPA: hypothetical protein VNU46_01750, partial [Gemmatimonadaceae bacterium]|nr:hypothetical protein [Gemmatimonadaceae bacterium]